MKTRRIFLPKEEYYKLEQLAVSRGMTVQEYVDSALLKLRGVK